MNPGKYQGNAAANVRYTEYPKVRHNGWERAHVGPELPGWLFSHALRNKEQPSP